MLCGLLGERLDFVALDEAFDWPTNDTDVERLWVVNPFFVVVGFLFNDVLFVGLENLWDDRDITNERGCRDVERGTLVTADVGGRSDVFVLLVMLVNSCVLNNNRLVFSKFLDLKKEIVNHYGKKNMTENVHQFGHCLH